LKADFFHSVMETAAAVGSLYEGTSSDRQALFLFLDRNSLLSQSGFPSEKKEEILRQGSPWFPDPDVQKVLLDRLQLWLSAYKRSDEVRLSILISHGRDLLPETCRTYEQFISDERNSSAKTAWELLDYLLSVLETEVTGMDLGQTENLLAAMKNELPQRHLALFTGYLDYLSQRISGTRVSYSPRPQGVQRMDEAYSFAEFSAMAYCIFNERYWEEHGLLEKACQSRQQANLWAFLSFFFLCGLRGTDVIRIPRPSLPCEGCTFRRKILDNAVPDPGQFARDIWFRIKYRSMFPNKTGKYGDIPALKLSIPAILEKPAGIIFSVAASYYPESSAGKPFLYINTQYKAIQRFFGKPFADILGFKGFSIRRANKAYLQGIESASGKSAGNSSQGYILAALARSHKGSLGTLPETTDIYLKDAAFSGMDPSFVLFEMFQRGVFGFIPHLLMEICFGNRYHRLDIHSQTGMIRQAGISPSGIESLVRASDQALGQAQLIIRDLLSSRADMQSTLERIASGEAAAKQEHFLCAMTAAGFPCAFPDRRGCVGCPYEICTKAALHQLTAEFERLQSLASGKHGWREREIARTAVLPVIREFFATMPLLYPEADLSPYHSILQGGINHYDPFISTGS